VGVKVGGKKWVQLSLREYPHFFDSPEILGDAIVGLFLFGDFTNFDTLILYLDKFYFRPGLMIRL